MVNRVTLIGNLGKDPEIRRLDNGAVVAQFSLATNENYKDKNGEWQTLTEWHNVVAWRGLAEQAERNFKKGNTVFIEGKMTTRKYTDSNNIERYTTEVVANYMRSLEKRESTGGYQNAPISAENDAAAYRSQVPPTNGASQNTPPQPVEGGDDLPF
jgi:single-strand DNA-binding protein